MAKYCNCGKYNNYYKYILLSVFFNFLSTVLFGIGYCNNTKNIYIANVYPDETKKTQKTLSHHIIIHNIYRNFGILVISIFLYKYERNISKSKNDEETKNIDTEINNSPVIELIYEKVENNFAIKSQSMWFILFIALLFNIQDVLTVFYYQYDLSQFNLWILPFPLFSYFNYKMLKVKIYSHHKFSLYLSVISCLLTKILSIFIYMFSESFKDFVYNKHKFLYPIGIIIYIIIIIIRAYADTEIKKFMDYKYISLSKILIFIGLSGIAVNIIIMLISSFIKCSSVDDIDIHLCNVDYVNLNNMNDRNETYFENILIYFKILNDSIDDGRYYEIIIEFFICLFGVVTHFFYSYFYFLIIKHLSTIHTIFYSLVYSFSIRIISIIISISSNSFFNQGTFNIPIFIFTGISDIFAGFGICVYCEVFELNFCNLNYNLRRNIIKRGEDDLINDQNLEKNEYCIMDNESKEDDGVSEN